MPTRKKPRNPIQNGSSASEAISSKEALPPLHPPSAAPTGGGGGERSSISRRPSFPKSQFSVVCFPRSAEATGMDAFLCPSDASMLGWSECSRVLVASATDPESRAAALVLRIDKSKTLSRGQVGLGRLCFSLSLDLHEGSSVTLTRITSVVPCSQVLLSPLQEIPSGSSRGGGGTGSTNGAMSTLSRWELYEYLQLRLQHKCLTAALVDARLCEHQCFSQSLQHRGSTVVFRVLGVVPPPFSVSAAAAPAAAAVGSTAAAAGTAIGGGRPPIPRKSSDSDCGGGIGTASAGPTTAAGAAALFGSAAARRSSSARSNNGGGRHTPKAVYRVHGASAVVVVPPGTPTAAAVSAAALPTTTQQGGATDAADGTAPTGFDRCVGSVDSLTRWFNSPLQHYILTDPVSE
eukprot:GHVU01134264.1.p1 GENE.GHVU01134264.1~~GHVU01134264.1.p1  ORF type:complete len:405 (-),score=58.28 GHVU01134264.1:12-1226(-)